MRVRVPRTRRLAGRVVGPISALEVGLVEMRTGVTLFAQNYSDWDRYEAGDWDTPPKISDAQIYEEEVAIGSLVEPLGFDSMWTVEHHFTPYTMDNNTLQFLTYFAGKTERIDFGTMVIVLPWHDPIRVAEEASMLDNFLMGRKLNLGFGRGAAKVEYDGLRVDMDSSRARFLEALEVVRKALSQPHFHHEGKYFQIPELSIRPQPRSKDLLDRMYMAWGSPTSVPIAAENGLKSLIIPQKDWSVHIKEMEEYNAIRATKGLGPGQPVVLLAVYVAETEEEANTIGLKHIVQYSDSARRHYQFDKPEHLANVKGYEYYNSLASKWTETHETVSMADAAKALEAAGSSFAKEFMKTFTESHVWGTPDQVFELIKDRVTTVGASEFVGVFKFGDMSVENAEKSLRLFAKEVLPRLKAMETPAPIVPQGATTG
jgi:alkanesulfonate monooxygenase SsuD/methylene tetrahydromethanopterin reductase-like flavin-dependent oxidoreductase (luciferase family)